eukprot:scaffold190279_cov18-Tisochrysis_lutea.AAC.1
MPGCSRTRIRAGLSVKTDKELPKAVQCKGKNIKSLISAQEQIQLLQSAEEHVVRVWPCLVTPAPSILGLPQMQAAVALLREGHFASPA